MIVVDEEVSSNNYKLIIAAADAQKTDQSDYIHFSNRVDLSNALDLFELPDNLFFNGDLCLHGCKNLNKLPENLKVLGSINITDCYKILKLPRSLYVGRYIIAGDRAKELKEINGFD